MLTKIRRDLRVSEIATTMFRRTLHRGAQERIGLRIGCRRKMRREIHDLTAEILSGFLDVYLHGLEIVCFVDL